MPLSKDDVKYFGPLLPELCEAHLVKDSEGWYVMPPSHLKYTYLMNFERYHTDPKFLPYPSRNISIRPPVLIISYFSLTISQVPRKKRSTL